MVAYVLDVSEIDHTRVAQAGGKGAQLGELSSRSMTGSIDCHI